jgi:hypothetical protein
MIRSAVRIPNREQFNRARMGMSQRGTAKSMNAERGRRFLIGNREVIDALKAGVEPGAIEQRVQQQVQAFEERRRPYLVY